MKKEILIVEIDMSDVEPSWVIAIQKTGIDNRAIIQKHLIVSRGNGDRFTNVPILGEETFVLSVKKEIRES